MVGPTQFAFATSGAQLAWRLKNEYGKLPGRRARHRRRGRALAGGCRVQEKARSLLKIPRIVHGKSTEGFRWSTVTYGRVERT